MIGIYKITSPIGKVYIGQSSDIEYRWKVYRNLRCKSQRLLYSSFIEYGVDNHKFDIIEECEFEYLFINEKIYISKYNSIINGLNLQVGGSKKKEQKTTTTKPNKLQQLTKSKTIRFSETQMNSLSILESYGVNINHFIRLAVKEKLQKDWKSIKEKKEKIIYPF
jgi:group I intron endonuclease